jgi:hypothetical protein
MRPLVRRSDLESSEVGLPRPAELTEPSAHVAELHEREGRLGVLDSVVRQPHDQRARGQK